MSLQASVTTQIPFPGLTIEMIDRQLINRFLLLKFDPVIEKRFVADAWADRKRQAVRTGWLGILVYDLYLIIDWQLLPDVFVMAAILRIAIFTPLAGLAIYAVQRRGSSPIRDGIAAAFSVMAVSLPLILFLQSHSALRSTYIHGTVLTMIYAAVVQRVRFSYAVAQTIGSMIAVSVALARTDALDDTWRAACMGFHATAAILLLSASYTLDRVLRRNYLLAVRAQRVKERLELGTRLDALTGLWNRRCLNQAMEAATHESAASGASLSVVLIDVDHFKLFNDVGGHLDGDECLTRISRCLGEVVQGGGAHAYRFGGEEFVIFAPGSGLAAALEIAARVREALHREAIAHPAFGPGAIVTASFGVAAGSARTLSSAALLAAADAALYRAKADGRDCIRVAEIVRSATDARDELRGMPGGRSAARALA